MLPKYKRILLKLSGESLMGDKNFGLDSEVIARYAQDIKSVLELGVQVAVVIGGGNIYRGMNEAESGIERAQGDYMGMLATVINGMALQSGMEKAGIYTRLQSAIKMEQIAEGKMNKFFKDNTLMAQPFVKDNSKSVADYLKSIDADLKVTEFKRVALG